VFDTLGEIIEAAAEGVRPAERLTVSQAAERYRFINNRGSYVGPWKNATTPYLVEPMDVLTRLKYTGMIFVGPAQCGKTDMYINWHTHTVVCDPADMMLVQTSQSTAADFSRRRVDRLHRDSKEVGKRLLPTSQADNTFDKRYRSGALITLSWPTINELSGKPIPRLYLTDYDRMDQDIEGNGAPFDLAAARTTTFGRHGMTAAESSPSFPVLDPRWVPGTRHEAPPTEGILSLYNRGDRRRWYWKCVECKNPFEPDFSLLKWEDRGNPTDSAETVFLECPHCAARYNEGGGNGRPGKAEMNRSGRWLRDGQHWPKDAAEPSGDGLNSDIASFWLKGVAAAFKTWRTIVVKYLQDFNGIPTDDQTGMPTEFTYTLVGTSTFAVTDVAGCAGLFTSDTSADDGVKLQLGDEKAGAGEGVSFAADYPTYFGCEFAVNDADQTDVLLGFVTTDTTALDGADTGLYFRSIDEATGLYLVLEKDTEETTTSCATLTDGGYVTAEFLYFDHNVEVYIDGTLTATVADSDANFPDDELLRLTIEFLTGDTSANTLTMKWIRYIQIQSG